MLEWKDIAIAVVGFLGGLIFNLFVKIMPTYVDLSKENQDLREKVRELESELDDERDLREREKERDQNIIDTRELKSAMDALKQRRRKDDPKDDLSLDSEGV